MCPDRQILSVYFDGELDSPWKEKFEKHLEICPSCRERLAAYRVTRQRLTETPLGREDAALERILEKTGFALKPRRRFWTGSVTLPIPVASAAGLIMILTLAALIVLRQPVKTSEPPLAGLDMQEMISVSDMASFFQQMGNAGSADMVIIRLPNTTFRNAGEPRMLRAADYPRNGAVNSGGRSPSSTRGGTVDGVSQ
ncbi:MAG: zf-HC2 domain-containing protein [Spirochaetaceae bacterium]|jgi:hypothetical protein|nr:zf-HC2 domain-containing protein [Spirochaetaceae bacterium]